MQAVRKNMQYATAGKHAVQADMMHVRGNVYLPYADAGRAEEGRRQAYVHDGPVPSSKRYWTVNRNGALVFLCLLFVFFGVKILTRVAARANESKNISAMQSSIAATIEENQRLAVKVAKARDSSRICYSAVQDLGMVSSAAVEAVPVIAPDTRPYGTMPLTTAAQTSPSAAGYITGSR